jgi:carboxyl-terminal processing protease
LYNGNAPLVEAHGPFAPTALTPYSYDVKTLRFSVFSTFVFAALAGVVFAQEQADTVADPDPPRPTTDLSVSEVVDDFDAAWSFLAETYYDPQFQEIDWEGLLEPERSRIAEAVDAVEAYGMFEATVDALESPTTAVLPPWEVAPAESTAPGEPLLEYGGVGILLGTTVDNEILALQVFRETPAERSGVLIGDVIVGVDGWRVEGEDAIDQVVSRVRGVVDTVVALTLRDPDGEERTLEVTRGRIDLRPSVEARVLDNGTGYIRLPALNTDLVDQASRSLPALLSSRNMVLDLRGVSIGGLDSMTTLAQWFLGAANVGGFLTNGGAQGLPYRTDAVAVYQRPMVVLTDSRTSGVPEMLASVLRNYKRAGLVGGQTDGNFELARVQELPSGGLIGVAFARYVAPDGRLPSVEGLVPDIPLEPPELAELRAGRDVHLEAAIEALEGSPRW